ncbi:MAG: hypothetical protein ABH823_01710 [bacterium]
MFYLPPQPEHEPEEQLGLHDPLWHDKFVLGALKMRLAFDWQFGHLTSSWSFMPF